MLDVGGRKPGRGGIGYNRQNDMNKYETFGRRGRREVKRRVTEDHVVDGEGLLSEIGYVGMDAKVVVEGAFNEE